MHNDSKLDPETNKPDIISDYDANSGGIDTVDKIFMNYSSSRNNRNFIQHSKHSECPKIQNDISKELVNIFDETLSDEERTTISKKKIQATAEERNPEEPPPKIRGRCFCCRMQKNRMTTINCKTCNRSECKEHTMAVITCQECRKKRR